MAQEASGAADSFKAQKEELERRMEDAGDAAALRPMLAEATARAAALEAVRVRSPTLPPAT